METATSGNEMNAISCRVKFDKQNFLEIAHIAKPRIIYHRKNMHFFAHDRFVMYCDQCENTNFSR